MNLGNYRNQESSIEFPTYIRFEGDSLLPNKARWRLGMHRLRQSVLQPSGVDISPNKRRRRSPVWRRPRWLFLIIDWFQASEKRLAWLWWIGMLSAAAFVTFVPEMIRG